MTWSEWWVKELQDDPAYQEVVTPLLVELLAPVPGNRYLDVGCGEGRLGTEIGRSGAQVVGVDISVELLRQAVRCCPVVAHELPSLGCFADASFDGAFVSLVLEHIEDYETAFSEMARVTRPGGVLALVVNHPMFTAPESAPIVDSDDETLWRPGRYFDHGWTEEPVGKGSVRFHHRPMGDLLTAASDAGWDLRRLVEVGPSEDQIERMPLLGDQRHIPRLLGARWVCRGATMVG